MDFKCNKKMYELSEEIKALMKESHVLLDNGDTEKAEEKMSRLRQLRKEYETEKELFDTEKLFSQSQTNDAKEVKGTSAEQDSPEAVFLKAFRSRFSDYSITKDLMSEGSGTNGGYTVPQDIQTKINEYKTNRFSFEDYVGVENVKTLSGSRTFRKRNQSAPFQQVNEGAAIPLIANPQYEVLSYSVKKYAGIIQVTNELFEDSDANITAEISKHLALCREDTVNAQILTLLTAKAETALSVGIASLRAALIKTLGAAYTPTARIYTNDDGYAYLCNLQDNDNRDYFFYDPSQPGKPAINIGGMIVPVVQVPNAVMASTPAANNRTKMPFIIGDLVEAVNIFDRRQMTLAASNSATITYVEGTGNDAVTHNVSAFQSDMTFLRAGFRADFKSVDTNAWINGSITA